MVQSLTLVSYISNHFLVKISEKTNISSKNNKILRKVQSCKNLTNLLKEVLGIFLALHTELS